MDNNSKKIFAGLVYYTGRNDRPAACLIWPIGHPSTTSNPQPCQQLLRFGNVKRFAAKKIFKSDKSKICRFFTKSRFLQSKIVVFCNRVASHTQKHIIETC